MRPIVRYGAIAVAAMLIGGYFLISRTREVEIVHPTLGPVVEAVYASGTVEPTITIKIAPKSNGRLKALLVDEDDNVTAGQPLARLDAEEQAANVAQLQARLALAEREAGRARELLARGVGTTQARDKAISDLHAAQAALAMARKQMSEMTLLAPADGRIIRRDGEIGDLIMANQTLFHMSGPEPLRIEADVDEEDIPRVRIGQPVLIRSDSFPGQVFDGAVQEITPMGDSVARSYRVRISLPTDTRLMIGMTVETNIVVRRSQAAMLIPSTAVTGGRVWLVKDGKLAQREVQAGVVGPERAEIKSGLDRGDQVVVRQDSWFQPGKHVRAVLSGNGTGAKTPGMPNPATLG